MIEQPPLLYVELLPAGGVYGAVITLPAHSSDGYSVQVTAHDPQSPGYAKPEDDCAAGRELWGPQDSVAVLLDPLLTQPPDPATFNGLAPYFPRCVPLRALPAEAQQVGGSLQEALGCGGGETSSRCPLVHADPYAAYNMSTGRYYVRPGVEASASIPAVPLPRAAATLSLGPISGSTGLGMTADCEECPPTLG